MLVYVRKLTLFSMKKMLIYALMVGLVLAAAACNKPKAGVATQDDKDKEIDTTVEDSLKVKELENRVMELEEKLKQAEESKVVPDVGRDKLGPDEVRDQYEEVDAYNGPNFITLDSPKDGATFTNEEDGGVGSDGGLRSITSVVFKGSVSPNVSKIEVKASGGVKGEADGMGFVPYWEDNYTLRNFKKGDRNFKYTAKIDYKNLNFGTNDYTFTAYFDNDAKKSVSMQIFLVQGGAEMGKPVIYLYPQKTSKVFVNVEPTNGISISDPEIGEGWNVVATPEGKITLDGKDYPYLFWEGFATNFKTPAEGFVMKTAEVSKFFDEKLAVLGLNKKEIADFKEYWVPILSEEPYYFITFIDQIQFEKYAPLTVEPKPDSVIRVFFDYKGLQKPIKVTEQKLAAAIRKGFSVIEWGGRLYR